MDLAQMNEKLKGLSLVEIMELALVGLELKENSTKEEARLANAREYIKRALRSQGLSVHAFAEKTSMSYSALNGIINGSIHPTHAWKVNICVVLQRTYTDIWEIDN